MSNKPFGDKEGVEDVLAALDELAEARDSAGIPLFAPAGNLSGQDVSNDRVLNHAQTIVVTRCRSDGAWVKGSHGECIDFAAPGEGVYTTFPRWSEKPDDAEYEGGTSMAAPCAGGVAALLLGVRPKLATSEILKLLQTGPQAITNVSVNEEENTVEGIPMEQAVGVGVIDAGHAMDAALDMPE